MSPYKGEAKSPVTLYGFSPLKFADGNMDHLPQSRRNIESTDSMKGIGSIMLDITKSLKLCEDGSDSRNHAN